MATSNNTYLDYDGLKVYTQALLGKFALSSKTPELDSNGIIKSQYLPSYVDDVVEYANRAAFPSVGDKSKLYLAQDTGDIYRWTGTQYVNMLSADGIAAQAAKVTNALKFGSKSYDGSVAQTITKADLGLGNVENVALSTWKGSTNITTLGVITTGTWQGTKIANAYLANSSITIGTTKFNLGDAKTAIEGLTSLLFSGASGALTYNKTDKYYSLADNLVVNGILASGTSGTGGGDGYSQVEWADIQKMTESVSGLLASAYAVKEAYNELNTAIETLAGKATNVTFTQTIKSGKQIGSISIDGKSTSLYAPANYAWSEITGKPSFAAVATSGSYTDLANKPTIASLMGSAAIGGTSSYIYWNGSVWATKALGNNAFTNISKVSQLTNDSGYLTGITKAMVESVLTGTITSHTHTFASLISKPTTLSGYGITDASRIFRYTIPASGNKGVRIAFTSHEPVKITVSGENGNAQLMLVGTGYGAGGFLRNNFTELVQSFDYYTWCLADENRSVEVFSTRAHEDVVTVESPSPVTFTAISALSKPAAYRHLLTSANYSSYALPLTGGTISGLLTITANANYGLSVNSILANSQAAGINFQINGTTYGRVLVKNTKELLYNDMTKTYTVYHSGNSNNADTVWSAKRLATPDNLICPYIWKQNDLNLTGTLVLSLPYGFNSMMQCIELTVYDYSTAIGYGGATKFFINGYNYAGNSWTNPYVFQIGNKNVKVRLGYYNNKCCILIGETNTKWTYPRICVDKVYGSYSSHANDFKNDDWSCAILQDESGITDIKTASDTPLYAPCYTRAGLPYVTDNDVAAKYLKLAGGTISGWLIINASTLPISELTTDGITSNNTWNIAQNVNLLLRSANNAMTISLGGQENERKGIIQVGHSAQSYAKVLGDLYLNKFGGNVYIGENIAYHAGNANKSDVNWSCSTMSSMAIGSPYSDVFDANNPDRWINSNYGSANKDYSNMPSGWKYGTVLTIGQQNYRGINGVLNAQFVWDVQSGEDANHPGRLWWRTKNANTGWKNWQELLHTGNYSSYALPRTGGTITGSIKLEGDYPSIVPFVRNFKSVAAGGWSRAIAEIRVDNKNAFRIAAYGSYTPNAENNKIQYAYLGFASYNGLNLRISETSLSWGDNVIYHAGNCNLPTIPWTCSSLTANGHVIAKNVLFGQSLEFSNIGSSANHGGYIDFHFNGSTADYTSRIIEDAASQLTLIASTVKATGDVKATGWCKATSGFLIEESGVYYTHHSQFGEIDIVKGNEFIWGSKTDTLYFNYRASANETTTVAHYIWNAGSPTTYATHTMGTLTVIGAITATTTIHATTGIYTDGYISARKQDTASDIRLKKDFRKIDNALKYVLNTHYTRFRWKDDNKESIGIIAQEEQNREYGFLVQNRKEIGHLTYDYAASTALLGAAIQEEDSKVEKLRKRIIKLENELSNLKKKWQH